jgi:flagellar protein FlaJ
MRIPFMPFPLEKGKRFSNVFIWIADDLAKFFPALQTKLKQAGIEIKAREYISLALFSSFFWFCFMLFLFSFLFFALKVPKPLLYSFLISLIFLFLPFNYILLYPNFLIIKKNRDIDKNLLFAVKHLLIQIKSGIPLYDSLVSVAKSGYGVISEEFEACTKEIATGKDQIEALEAMVIKNPNLNFRRIIWQIINSLRAGADVGATLESIAKTLAQEQNVQIRKYGSQLSPLALMYLMISVILPTLGTTFIIIFATFSGTQIPPSLFILILGFLVLFQFAFLGMIKSRRPSVEI